MMVPLRPYRWRQPWQASIKGLLCMVEQIIPKFVFEKEQLRRIHLSAIYQKLVKPVRKQTDIFSGSVEQW